MKKTLTYSALAITSIIGISSANAELENTLSVGYAWSSLEKGYTLKGVSLKYLHQMGHVFNRLKMG